MLFIRRIKAAHRRKIDFTILEENVSIKIKKIAEKYTFSQCLNIME